mmetsp:Transcript_5067/g.20237  ORF Transcript_5067/g.20237 Transcript_5067/m.20237 type:complete len:237 (-) Transcript_5067:192-902(-)|eukprot:scaffold83_cov246-Pinguiococcus_pyrenoidosus.AAC.12
MDVGKFFNPMIRLLFAPSQMDTPPSHPPVAKVPNSGWKATAFTGKITSPLRWHLKEYFFPCIAGSSLTYSTATRPSMEPSAKLIASGLSAMQRVWYFRLLCRRATGSLMLRRSNTQTAWLADAATTTLSRTDREYTLPGISTLAAATPFVPLRVSQVFTVRSHEPVTTSFRSSLQPSALTAASWLPSSSALDVATSKSRSFPSSPPHKALLSSRNAQQSAGAPAEKRPRTRSKSAS